MKYLLKRTIAYLIDCAVTFAFVMIILQWGILSNFRSLLKINEEWFMNSLNMELYVLFTISIPVWAYFSYFDSDLSKGTFGKRICKLQVQKNDNQKISIGISILRTVLKLLPWEIAHIGVIFPTPLYYEIEPDVRILSYCGILLFLIYIISIFVDKNRQTLYDKILKTWVIKKTITNN